MATDTSKDQMYKISASFIKEKTWSSYIALMIASMPMFLPAGYQILDESTFVEDIEDVDGINKDKAESSYTNTSASGQGSDEDKDNIDKSTMTMTMMMTVSMISMTATI